MRTLEAAARSDLVRQGFKPDDVYCQAYLNLRFRGTDTALMTPASPPLHKAPEPGGGGGSSGGSGGGDNDALESFFDQYRSVTLPPEDLLLMLICSFLVSGRDGD